MTASGYTRGFTGLGEYLGVTPKTARSIDRRIKFPKIQLPGIVRPTTLFKLSDVDETLSPYRQETAPAAPAGAVDINGLVEEIVGRRKVPAG